MINSIGCGTTFRPLLRSCFCLCVVACLFACLFTKTAFADTYQRQSGIDAVNYVFRLTLNDDVDEILGEATVDLRFLKDSIADFTLDLASVNDGKGMRVSEVQSRGAALRFTHDADLLRVTLDSPSRAGERRQFIVRYRGVPAKGLRILKNKFGERCFFSENWPNNERQWLPMIDHPYDKATSEFIVTAPIKYQVVANGLLQEETDLGDGRRLTHWKQSVPIASWLNALGVAQFSAHHAGSVKGVELQTWVFHQERETGPAGFETTARQAVEFFSEQIGPYSYEKLANVEAAGFGGGTEHASAIFYGENSIVTNPATGVARPVNTGLIAHEIAHQWFGDAVTEKDWDDVWLSEGGVGHREARRRQLRDLLQGSHRDRTKRESENDKVRLVHRRRSRFQSLGAQASLPAAAVGGDGEGDDWITVVDARSGNKLFQTNGGVFSFSWNPDAELIIPALGKFVFDWNSVLFNQH